MFKKQSNDFVYANYFSVTPEGYITHFSCAFGSSLRKVISRQHDRNVDVSGCQGLRRGWGQVGHGCGQTRATWRAHGVKAISAVSMSIAWSWRGTTVLLDVTIGRNWGRWHTGLLCIISHTCPCTTTLNIKSLIKGEKKTYLLRIAAFLQGKWEQERRMAKLPALGQRLGSLRVQEGISDSWSNRRLAPAHACGRFWNDISDDVVLDRDSVCDKHKCKCCLSCVKMT